MRWSWSICFANGGGGVILRWREEGWVKFVGNIICRDYNNSVGAQLLPVVRPVHMRSGPVSDEPIHRLRGLKRVKRESTLRARDKGMHHVTPRSCRAQTTRQWTVIAGCPRLSERRYCSAAERWMGGCIECNQETSLGSVFFVCFLCVFFRTLCTAYSGARAHAHTQTHTKRQKRRPLRYLATHLWARLGGYFLVPVHKIATLSSLCCRKTEFSNLKQTTVYS